MCNISNPPEWATMNPALSYALEYWNMLCYGRPNGWGQHVDRFGAISHVTYHNGRVKYGVEFEHICDALFKCRPDGGLA